MTSNKRRNPENGGTIDLTSDDGDDPVPDPRTAKRHCADFHKVPAADAEATISPRHPSIDATPTPAPSIVTPIRPRTVFTDGRSPSAAAAPPSVISEAATPGTRPATPLTTLPPGEQTPLHRLPVLADRYVPKASITDGVEYTSPQKFSLNPACWRRWQPRHYSLFAHHLRHQFDPVPFAQQTGLSVDEIANVFTAVVCNTLYDAKEACKRGEEGMVALFEHQQKCGTVTRKWRDGKAAVKGELHKVKKGGVEVILEIGSKRSLAIEELSERDKTYLQETLTDEDVQLVLGTQA